jgi:carbon-monoxide dehydrogenase small subunit
MLSPRTHSTIVSFTLDGRTQTLEAWSDDSALQALHGRFGRTELPSRCEQGLCGTCELLVDGQPTRICLLPAARLDGVTIERPTSWPRPARPSTGGSAPLP